MIEIEFCEPFRSVCACCGGSTVALTRFVKKGEDAWAVYYAYFTDSHPERGLIGLISLGTWGTDDVPSDRVAFGFEMWTNDESYQIGIIDAEKTPWGNAKIIGAKLTRGDALAHPWLEDVFHLTDHIADEDKEIREFFSQETVH